MRGIIYTLVRTFNLLTTTETSFSESSMKTRNPKMGMDAKNEEKNAPELKHWSEKKHDFPPVQIQMMSHEQGSMLRLYIVSDPM